MKYIYGGRYFNRKVDVLDEAQRILKRGGLREVEKGDDKLFLIDLFNEHPKFLGTLTDNCNISIEEHKNSWGKSRCFFINGDPTSYKKCGLNKSKNISTEIKKAYRLEVLDQIRKFRKGQFSNKRYLKCPVLNINFSKKTCIVDHHIISFDELVFNFLAEKGMKLSEVSVEKNPQDSYYFSNRDLAKDWKDYHKNNCTLRCTHRAGNLSLKKGKRLVFY